MTSVVVNQRGAATMPDALRGMIMAAVTKELAKPRATEDPALRGFFRDLQSAMNASRAAPAAAAKPAVTKKPVPAKPATATKPRPEATPKEILVRSLPALVDPKSPPGTPGPTVH
jgi:hypothetical protein